MGLYPVFLKLKDSPCLVVGGGKVADRKVVGLLAAEALVTLIAPTVTPALSALIEKGAVTHSKRAYRSGDVQGYALVIAATDSHAINRKIFTEALEARVLINSVDDPENCRFFTPAVLQRGDLQIAISTSGQVPYFAKRLRQFLEPRIPKEIEQDVRELGSLRQSFRTGSAEHEQEAQLSHVLNPKVDEILRKMDQA